MRFETRRTVPLLDAYTLEPLRQLAVGADAVEGSYEHHTRFGDALLLGEHNCVVLSSTVTAGTGLTVVAWS